MHLLHLGLGPGTQAKLADQSFLACFALVAACWQWQSRRAGTCRVEVVLVHCRHGTRCTYSSYTTRDGCFGSVRFLPFARCKQSKATKQGFMLAQASIRWCHARLSDRQRQSCMHGVREESPSWIGVVRELVVVQRIEGTTVTVSQSCFSKFSPFPKPTFFPSVTVSMETKARQILCLLSTYVGDPAKLLPFHAANACS